MNRPTMQAQFQEYCQRERDVTLSLARLSEDALTREQRVALDAYMQAVYAEYLREYGPAGPRGNHLRMESEAETTTRLAWEEAIKPAWRKLQDRIELAVLEYWRQHIDDTAEDVHISDAEEEASEQQLGYWREDGTIGQADRLFEVELRHGWKRDNTRIEVWVALHPGGDLEIVQARCIAVEVNGYYYPVRNLANMDAGDRADLASE